MYKRRNPLATLILSWAVLAIHQKNTAAGPMKRLTRMTREVYPEIEPESDGNQAQVCIVGDVVYAVDEPVPAEQPCLKCKCQPPGVLCETIRCTKKPGCKAIHRPNKCCPDYQCECEHNGRIYGNGEKLETPPGGECKVCYCRGGEVQCAEVSCYIRKDCEGKRVQGQCCPKYDHCPPIDSLPDRSTNSTETILTNIEQAIYETWSITPLPPNTSRFQDENKIPDSYVDLTKLPPPPSTEIEIDNLQIDDKPLTRITIHEIIPDVKEIPITSSPKTEEPPTQGQGQLVIEQEVGSSNDLVGGEDTEPDSSEILEVFHPPPPVLRVGDKLIYLKKEQVDTSTPSSVITVVGAEGLQRGGVEDSGEIQEKTVGEATKNSTVAPSQSLFDTTTNDLDLEPKASESTHILSLVKRKKPTTTTPETVTELKELTTTVVPDSTSEGTTGGLTETTTVPLIETSTNVILSTTESHGNPAYPPIPEIMTTSQDEQTTIKPREQTDGMKILPEVLEIRNNKTIPENTTNSEWLKTESSVDESLVNLRAALPDDLLNQPAPTDEDNSTETSTVEFESTTSEAVRFTEGLGSMEESGENTTPKTNQSAPILSGENASIASGDKSGEISDMLSQSKETSSDNTEATTVSTLAVDIVSNNNTNKSSDVEVINLKHLEVEALPKPEKLLLAKSIGKRANSPVDEADEVFKQLDVELNAENTERTQTKEQEQKEADTIFKELLEETSTPKVVPTAAEGRNKDAELLQRVSDALAKLTLRGKQPDSSVLGILSNFFSSQYRYYDKK